MIKRKLAEIIVRHASNVMPDGRETWASAISGELVHIRSEDDALTFALGCVQASYHERIRSMKTLAMASRWLCALLLAVEAAYRLYFTSETVIWTALHQHKFSVLGVYEVGCLEGLIGIGAAAALALWKPKAFLSFYAALLVCEAHQWLFVANHLAGFMTAIGRAGLYAPVPIYLCLAAAVLLWMPRTMFVLAAVALANNVFRWISLSTGLALTGAVPDLGDAIIHRQALVQTYEVIIIFIIGTIFWWLSQRETPERAAA